MNILWILAGVIGSGLPVLAISYIAWRRTWIRIGLDHPVYFKQWDFIRDGSNPSDIFWIVAENPYCIARPLKWLWFVMMIWRRIREAILEWRYPHISEEEMMQGDDDSP